MSYNHAIRITQSYDAVKHVIDRWSERCSRMIVYEHEADDEIARTHVHIAMWNCEVKSEALKRMWPDAPGKGNEFWAWKDCDKDFAGDITPPDKIRYVTYMSKGKLEPKFVKFISKDLVERSRQDWVEPDKAAMTGDWTERYINDIVDIIKKKFVYSPISDEERCERIETSIETLLKLVRHETFRKLYGANRRFPHASHYKIVAGSVFMRLCEHYGCFDAGMEIVSELWL